MGLFRIIFILNFASQLLGANVEKCSQKQLNDLSEESSNPMEIQLLENLEIQLLKVKQEFQICSPKQIVSFFLAYHAANISAVRDVLKDSAKDNAKNNWSLFKQAYDATTNASENYAWIGSNKNNFDAPWDMLLRQFMTAELQGVRRSIRKIINLDNDISLMSNEEIKLKNLHQILSYIAQESFINGHFKKIYGIILVHLHRDNNFTMSAADTLSFIGQTTWEQEKLRDNEYIKSLKKVMTAIVE